MRILPVFIPHAGCRNDCIYCNQTSTSQVAELPSANDVLQQVEEALRGGPLDEVAYYGGSFTALSRSLQKTYLNLLQPYLSAGAVGGIRLSTRPDAVNEQTVALLQTAGVKTVELGCQSFSDQVLEAAGRGHKSVDSVAAAVLLRHHGFKLGIQLMPGLPAADRHEVFASLDTALALAPDFLRIYPTVVLDSTRLAELWRQGDYRPLELNEAVDICADIDLICRQQGVSVIRYGLQSNRELDGGAVLAGPYHPAFGQLVKSRLWLRMLRSLLNDGHVDCLVHPADLSDAIGHGRSNLLSLRNCSHRFSVQAASNVPRHSVQTGATVYDVASYLITARG